MQLSVEQQLEAIRRWMSQWNGALVSYSGGVDSAVVLAAAQQQYGERLLACIAVSPSYPAREQRDAVALAEQLGARYRLVEAEEHLDPRYAANPVDRCYFCKAEWYGRIRRIADKEAWPVILDGTNASDLGDDRPGRRAGAECGVRSPLVELGINKEQVRQLARRLRLSVWDKPAMACLASRVPHGNPITAELLHQIERAEDALAALGFRQFRVRHHGELARIELPLEDFERAAECRAQIVDAVRDAGYRFVCLDLAGFRGTPPVAAVDDVTSKVNRE